MIILIAGLPGTGKTFFADKLGRKLNAERISSDRVRNEILKMGEYDIQSKMVVYTEMLKRMQHNAQLSKDQVIDATFYKSGIRQMFKKASMALNEEIVFVEIRADDKTVKQRTGSKRKESEADFDVYLKLKKEFEPIEEEHLVLYSDKMDIETMLERSIEYIKSR